MNIPYEMFLTIQMHLTCRKDHIHNRLQEKKDETCSEEQVTTVQDEEKYDECSDIIDVEPSSYEEVTKKKGKTSSRIMMSRIHYQYVKGGSYFHNAVDGNIIQARFIAQGFSQK